MRYTGKSRPAAFTLIELLVVTSIISMLMAITMPSLNRARKAGKSAVCLSNLRQLNVAWITYAIENNEMICSSDTDWNHSKPPWWDEDTPARYGSSYDNWVSDGPGGPYNNFSNTETAFEKGVLWPYLEQYDIYRCPSVIQGSGRSYSISHAMGSHHMYFQEKNFHSTNEISMPSQKMVFIDHIPPYRDQDGVMQWVGNAASVILIDTYLKSWEDRLVISPITCRHNDRTNMSFVDGHVENWKWVDTRTIKLLKNEIDKKEASIDNPDIFRLLPLIRGAEDRKF